MKVKSINILMADSLFFDIKKESINPLTKYRTYSYHHILIACSTTDVAELLANTDDYSFFTRQSEQQTNTFEDPYAKYKPIELSDGKYVILINGMTDADFIIDSINWTSRVHLSGEYASDAIMSGSEKGSMVISEPRGMRLMNVLFNLATEFETEPLGITYVLKTIFIGHPGSINDSNFPDPITNVRPVFFTLHYSDATFDITGGTYNFTLTPNLNSLSDHQIFSSANDGAKIDLSRSRILKDAIKIYEDNLNRRYLSTYAESVEGLRKANPDVEPIKVIYEIKINEPYNDSSYITDTHPEVAKDTGATVEGGHVVFSNTGHIRHALYELLKRCSKVQEEANPKDPKTTAAYIPHIDSFVRHTKDNTVVVSFTINRNLIFKSGDLLDEVLTRPVGTQSDNLSEHIKQNIFTLNYIYTGKNIDVLDLTMKIDFSSFQFLEYNNKNFLTENSDLTQGDAEPTTGTSYAIQPSAKTDINTGKPYKKMIVPPRSMKSPTGGIKNVPDQQKVDLMQWMFINYTMANKLTTSVVIHGNPLLMNSVNRSPSDFENEELSDADENAIFPHWQRIPSLVLINIRMPASSDNNSTTEPFFFQSVYGVKSITNSFEHGEFKQTLEIKNLAPAEQFDITEKSLQKAQERRSRNAIPATSKNASSKCANGFDYGKVSVTDLSQNTTTISNECIRRFSSSALTTFNAEREYLNTVLQQTPDIDISLLNNNTINNFLLEQGIDPNTFLSSGVDSMDSLLSEGGIAGTLDEVSDFVGSLSGDITDFANKSLAQIKNQLSGVGDSLIDSVLGVKSLDDLGSVVDNFVNELSIEIDSISTIVSDSLTNAQQQIDEIGNLVSQLPKSSTPIGTAVSDAVNDAKTLANSLAAQDYVPENLPADQPVSLDGIKETFNGAVSNMTQEISKLGGITDKIQNNLVDLSGGFQEISGFITDQTSNTTNIQDAIDNFVNGNLEQIKNQNSLTKLKGQLASILGIQRKPTTTSVTKTDSETGNTMVVSSTTTNSKGKSDNSLVTSEQKFPKDMLSEYFS